MRFVPILLLLVLSASADDFTTSDGQKHSGTIKRIEADGIVLSTDFGIDKVLFSDLPKEIQTKYHYDPAKAAEFFKLKSAATQALLDKAAAANKINTSKVAAEAIREGQSSDSEIKNSSDTTDNNHQKVLTDQKQGGVLIKPGLLSPADIATSPFTLRGYVVEMTATARPEIQEVSQGIYSATYYDGIKSVKCKVDADHVDFLQGSKSLFIRVDESSDAYVTKADVLGNAVFYQGLSSTPSFGWK